MVSQKIGNNFQTHFIVFDPNRSQSSSVNHFTNFEYFCQKKIVRVVNACQNQFVLSGMEVKRFQSFCGIYDFLLDDVLESRESQNHAIVASGGKTFFPRIQQVEWVPEDIFNRKHLMYGFKFDCLFAMTF